jgi:hypothetical protein
MGGMQGNIHTSLGLSRWIFVSTLPQEPSIDQIESGVNRFASVPPLRVNYRTPDALATFYGSLKATRCSELCLLYSPCAYGFYCPQNAVP